MLGCSEYSLKNEKKLISSGSTFENEIGYSRVLIDGNWVFVSRTTGLNYETIIIAEDFVSQMEQCLKSIDTTLLETNAKISDVVRVMYILPNTNQFKS